jgi:hypothetical protein
MKENNSKATHYQRIHQRTNIHGTMRTATTSTKGSRVWKGIIHSDASKEENNIY